MFRKHTKNWHSNCGALQSNTYELRLWPRDSLVITFTMSLKSFASWCRLVAASRVLLCFFRMWHTWNDVQIKEITYTWDTATSFYHFCPYSILFLSSKLQSCFREFGLNTVRKYKDTFREMNRPLGWHQHRWHNTTKFYPELLQKQKLLMSKDWFHLL